MAGKATQRPNAIFSSVTDDSDTLVAPLGIEPKEAPLSPPAPRSGTHRCATPAPGSEDRTHLWMEAPKPPHEVLTQGDEERTLLIPASGAPTALTRAALPSALPRLVEAPRAELPLPREEPEPSASQEWWEVQQSVGPPPCEGGGDFEPGTSHGDPWMLFAAAGFSAAGVVFLALAALLHHWGH